jgi:hypothetical protein
MLTANTSHSVTTAAQWDTKTNKQRQEVIDCISSTKQEWRNVKIAMALVAHRMLL